MPGLLPVDTRPLHQFLQNYLDPFKQIRAAEISATLYVCYDSRIMPILRLTQRNKQNTFPPLHSRWIKPTNRQFQVIQSGDIKQSDELRTATVPIHDLQDSNDLLGLIEIQSTTSTGKASGHPTRFSLQSESLIKGRATFEKLRLNVLLNWQLEVLQTLRGICQFDRSAHNEDGIYEELLSAALSIAPLACLGHIISVINDPVTGEPTALQLEYALPSSENKPAGQLKLEGRCPKESELHRYPVYEGLTGLCVRERKYRYFASLRDAPRYKKLHDTTQSEVCYPLIIGEQVIGVLNLESETPAAFTENDIYNLQVLADEIGLVLLAESGVQTRIRRYETGLQTFQRILGSLDSPKALIRAVLQWAREISTPDYEYASFTPSDITAADLEFDQSGNKPDHKGGPDVALALHHKDVDIGTLLLLTTSEHTSLVTHANKILEVFEPVLAAAIHTALAISLSPEREASGWAASAIRHTIQDVNISFTSASMATTEQEKLDWIKGALDFMSLSCDILTREMDSTENTAGFDVAAAVDEVRRRMMWRFDSEHIALMCQLPEDRPFIKGKPSTLKWALIELLNNALKFSKAQGRERVNLSVGYIQGSQRVTIRVDDDCDIIPEEERDAIWEKGIRGKHAMAIAVPGTGLGLSIVRRCCSKLGGWQKVGESVALRGNCFELEFDIDL